MVALLVLATSAPAKGATILVQSTFDNGDEGWRVGDFVPVGGQASPTFVPVGGNPGGFIRTTDLFSETAFRAPSQFLGNQSAAYGGNLHLEERVLDSDGLIFPLVELSDGSLRLRFRSTPPTTAWTAFDVPLVASAGWLAGGMPATEAQLQQVLSNLTSLHLYADWKTGQDQVDLDNVRLEAPTSTVVPLPSAALGGLALLGGLGLAPRRAAAR